MTDETRPNPSTLSDRDLLTHYQRTDGDPDNPHAEALLREIERRGLDF